MASEILIIDDNLGSRRLLEGLLAKEDYQLTLAESGFEALEILKSMQPDLILLDVMMPGMNGFEVCATIRAEPRLSEIPIIMITALDDDESMLKGIDLGADDFLSKPINRLELRSRVRGIIRLNRYRKLCAERRKFEWVVERSIFGFITIDKNDQIIFSNPTAREFLGLSDSDSSCGFLEQVTKTFTLQPPRKSEDWKAALQEKDSLIFVKPQTDRTPARWIKATVLDLDQIESGQRLLRLEDISQNMRSFQEKQTFSSMISHKMLTPLNALNAAQQMLAPLQEAPDNAVLKRVFNLQHYGLERLEYDIDSIIRYLDSSAAHPSENYLSVAEIIDEITQIGNESKLAFSLEAEAGELSSSIVRISKENFEACVREIIENASKYHPRNTPTLDFRILLEDTSKTLLLRFKNDGMRLSDHEIANAWKPYWQSDRFFTGEVKGMGLGLSMIASHIWSAGGTCEIANTENENGVILSLRLPTYPVDS